MNKTSWLRLLPAVDEILREPALAELQQRLPPAIVTTWARDAVNEARVKMLEGHLFREQDSPSEEDLRDWIVARIHDEHAKEMGTSIQPVINATGIILHTNLGRAPLSPQAIQRVVDAAGSSNVELDLHSGKRNQRGERISKLLQRLTSAEDAVIVNNCAAATMLVLQAVASGREVIVARGQLVEIGGGFRLPDVFRTAGVILREVGTTNRTYLRDYEAAITEQTGAIIRVHHSNFRMSGFVTEPSIDELATIARPAELAVIDDLGSGWIRDLDELKLEEPSVLASVRAGADLTLFSGDKLLGGPQCGIIVGRSEWIGRLRRHPLMRALRVDKLTLAALEATLEIHLSGEAARQIPVLTMLAANAEQVRDRCQRVLRMLGDSSRITIVPCRSQTGGGSVPGSELPSYGIQIAGEHPDAIARTLRHGHPAVQARIRDDCVLLDLRTVTDEQCEALADRLRGILDDPERIAAGDGVNERTRM